MALKFPNELHVYSILILNVAIFEKNEINFYSFGAVLLLHYALTFLSLFWVVMEGDFSLSRRKSFLLSNECPKNFLMYVKLEK